MLRFDKNESVANTKAQVIVNTVNTVGVMGAGVAKAVKDRFPEVMPPYLEACRQRRLNPSQTQTLVMQDGTVIINVASKEHFKDGSRYDWTGAILVYLSRILQDKRMSEFKTVLVPPPGAGLGGLNKSVVHDMMRAYLKIPALSDMEIIISDEERPSTPREVFYAGIGSRETPERVCDLMMDVATALAEKGWTLRSGNAAGADAAFEKGAPVSLTESYLPWEKQDVPHGRVLTDTQRTHELMMRAFYTTESGERWSPKMSRPTTLLMTRNGAQIFGEDFTKPSDLVISYTQNGAERGGTRQAMRLARAVGIPVMNLGASENSGLSTDAVVDKAVRLVEEHRRIIGIPIRNNDLSDPHPN